MKSIPILFEDKNLIAVHKPANMMVYEMGNNFRRQKCVLSRLEASFQRPFYPVHWLDRACSGIVILGKNSSTAFELAKAWSAKNCIITYQVLVKGHFQEKGSFDFPLRDWTDFKQSAVTHFKPIGSCGPVTLMEVQTETECRHQIRRHFSRRCANIMGDKRYGQGKWNFFFKSRYGLNRLFMHLSYIRLTLRNYKDPIEIHCPLPDELVSVLQQLAMAPSLLGSCGTQWVSPSRNTNAGVIRLND